MIIAKAINATAAPCPDRCRNECLRHIPSGASRGFRAAREEYLDQNEAPGFFIVKISSPKAPRRAERGAKRKVSPAQRASCQRGLRMHARLILSIRITFMYLVLFRNFWMPQNGGSKACALGQKACAWELAYGKRKGPPTAGPISRGFIDHSDRLSAFNRNSWSKLSR
jgi:hypothetical protein